MPETQTPLVDVGSRWEHHMSGNVHVVASVSPSEIRYSREDGGGRPLFLSPSNFTAKFRALPATNGASPARPRPAITPVDPDEERNPETVELGKIAVPDDRHEFENMILFSECEAEMIIGLNSILNASKLEEVWGISKIRPLVGRRILNFYGPPGTGKTMAGMCLGRKLNKRVYQVNYADILSKYHNAALGNIVKMFEIAKELDAILFLDEADSLVTKRAGVDDGTNHPIRSAHNNQINTFMQEVDAFDGIVVMTTNYFRNYDEAIIRRISRNVHFALPDHRMRHQLIKMHLTNLERCDVDFETVANEFTKKFSGGDILNMCVNAMERASLDDDSSQWKVTTELLIEEAKSITKAKFDHADNPRARREGPPAEGEAQ